MCIGQFKNEDDPLVERLIWNNSPGKEVLQSVVFEGLIISYQAALSNVTLLCLRRQARFVLDMVESAAVVNGAVLT